MLLTVLRFNFASPQGEPGTQSGLLSAALELAQWGESRGVTTVSVDEHHVTGHGWSCNPIMAASMFLARTSKLIASVDCALGPLWNPVRLAEDIALVDNMSRGRLHTPVGLGYRPVEYDSLGVDFDRPVAQAHRGVQPPSTHVVDERDIFGEPDRIPQRPERAVHARDQLRGSGQEH